MMIRSTPCTRYAQVQDCPGSRKKRHQRFLLWRLLWMVKIHKKQKKVVLIASEGQNPEKK